MAHGSAVWVPIAQLAATMALGVGAFFLAYRQWLVAKEKLRHDLYDRRFAIFLAFQDMLLASMNIKECDAEIERATKSYAHSRFLLSSELQEHLKYLKNEAFRLNGEGKVLSEGKLGISQMEWNENITN